MIKSYISFYDNCGVSDFLSCRFVRFRVLVFFFDRVYTCIFVRLSLGIRSDIYRVLFVLGKIRCIGILF